MFVGTWLYTGIVTKQALVALLASVSHLVLSESIVIWCREDALAALKRLLASVQTHVHTQWTCHGCCVVTNIAPIRSFLGVCGSHVPLQQGLRAKTPETLQAFQIGSRRFIWFFVNHLGSNTFWLVYQCEHKHWLYYVSIIVLVLYIMHWTTNHRFNNKNYLVKL